MHGEVDRRRSSINQGEVFVISKRTSIVIALAAAAAFASPAAAQVSMRLGHHHAVGGTVDLTANKFADLVREKTNGAVTIKVFPAAQLGQEREAYGLLNTGVLDFSITSLGILDQVYPPINVTSLPFVFRNWDHVYKAYDGDFGKALSDGIKSRTQTRLLGYLHLGFRDMIFRGEPLADVSAMKGVKMRSPEATMWVRMFELVGARPTPVTWGEVYTAMQTGVADGLESPGMAALDMKFNEVAKSVVRTKHMFGSMGIFANATRIGRLSAEQQKMIEAAGVEAATWSNKTISQPGEEEAYTKMQKLGMKIVEPTNAQAWVAAMEPLWKETTSRFPGSDALLKTLVETK
jgi:tripartite ATP-independent transporter DctP family solute receptor